MEDIDPKVLEALARRLLSHTDAMAHPLVSDLWDGYRLTVLRTSKSARDSVGCWRRLCAWRGPDGRTVAEHRTNEVDALWPAHYRAWRSTQITRRDRPPAVGTVNRELSVLRAVMNWAVAAGKLPSHPLCRIAMDPEDNVRQTAIRSEADFDLLLEACDRRHPCLRAMALLYFDAGLRRMEGMRARWLELSLKPGGGGYLALPGRRTKSGKPKVAHLTKRTMAALAALPRLSEWIFANASTERKHRRYRGRPYSPSHLYREFQAAVADSGLQAEPGEHITLHTLRHSFAYRARRNWKWPEAVIMRQGGWRTRSAFDRYGIVDDAELEEAMVTAETDIATRSR